MKKYIITSSRFSGEINVLYSLEGRLLFIDFMKSDLSDEQVDFFKNRLPVVYSEKFMEAFGNSKLTVMEEGYRVSFDQFWTRYNHKINRQRAEKQWVKLSEADQVNAYFRYAFYDRHLKLNPWKTKANPETYLKDRYWESEWK